MYLFFNKKKIKSQKQNYNLIFSKDTYRSFFLVKHFFTQYVSIFFKY